ncbi:hypothetical protein Acid345_3517 [Candidatus Koribacter versatilis Ellin345]|uniref:Uncharacterized protein n=1 Tax=Koribacter versatilis (strain Ellin345) TaxID=204669 RepID=Q1IKT2_KORVE|nr:hypothetical protein Acid345_3517 [Candidatus Koribacter versatilis Ellin345]
MTESGTRETENKDQNAKTLAGEIHWVHVAMLATQVILGVIGLLALAIYFCQLRQMIEQTKISRTSLESVQRAFVSNGGYQGLNEADAKGNIQSLLLSLKWRNSGNTPAVNARYHVNIIQGELPSDFRFPDRDANGNIVTDNESIRGFYAPQSDSYAIPLRMTQRRSVIYGWMKYDDVFDRSRSHITQFCDQLTWLPTPPKEPTATLVNPCPVHNCTDEWCGDQKR